MILCCGEALIDFIPTNGKDGEVYTPSPGGSVYNVAIGLGRLGIPTGFLGGIANDFFGDRLVERLTASGVDLRYVARLDRPCTLAFVTLGGDEPDYAFYDEGAADRMWTHTDSPSLDDAVSTLHFGSISLLREPAASAYADLMRAQKGKRVLCLDPNLRPGLVKDEPAYRALLDDLMAQADILKISAADLEWWAPGRRADDVAQDWLDAGAKLVVVTRGADGAVGFWSGGQHEQDAQPLDRIADAVGAGDAFTSGLLAGLSRADALSLTGLDHLAPATVSSAMALAVQVAGITVSRQGANPPTAAEIGLDPA